MITAGGAEEVFIAASVMAKSLLLAAEAIHTVFLDCFAPFPFATLWVWVLAMTVDYFKCFFLILFSMSLPSLMPGAPKGLLFIWYIIHSG